MSVDLTTSRIKILNINEELFKKFIGGMGLGSKILYDSLKPDVDALSPENLLIFATGPLTGLALPSSASFSIVTRSPLTNIFYSSTMRGNLGTKLKQAGFDMLVIKGASSSPVFLQIEENDCKIIGALDLWRKNIYQTDKILKSELGKDFAIAAIGIGGEKLVRFASINTDLYEHCVGGAVMGSKNLKAIAVNGKNRLQYYNFDKFKLVARKIFKKIRNCKDRICELRNRSYFSRDFTLKPMLQSLSVMSELEKNLLPTKNFQSANLGASYIPPEKFSEHISVKTEGCYLCNLKCLRHFIIKNEKYKSDCSAFYRLLPMLSSNWLISNPDTLAHAVALCNDYGVDSNSICNVIGFAMECAEKNLITENINFGNEVAVIELIKKIARRESIGNELAEGIKRYSEKINVTDFAAHVKGLEMSYDARAFPALALGYITSNAGDLPAKLLELEHTKYSSEDFVRVVKYVQEESSVIDSLVMCQLLPLETKDLVELTNATTGLELDEQEYLKIGERIWNLTRVFNVREGISRKDDTLPKRFTQEPLHLSDGKELKITKDEIDRMLSNYYSVRGWDENGIPKKEKLAELGLI